MVAEAHKENLVGKNVLLGYCDKLLWSDKRKELMLSFVCSNR